MIPEIIMFTCVNRIAGVHFKREVEVFIYYNLNK
jgi:hypothetical protein